MSDEVSTTCSNKNCTNERTANSGTGNGLCDHHAAAYKEVVAEWDNRLKGGTIPEDIKKGGTVAVISMVTNASLRNLYIKHNLEKDPGYFDRLLAVYKANWDLVKKQREVYGLSTDDDCIEKESREFATPAAG